MLLTVFRLNDNSAASVQRLAAIASARVQALLANNHPFINARRSVGNYGVFSLSFGTFLSLYFAIKEKEKYISKTIFHNNSYFFFFFAIKEEKVRIIFPPFNWTQKTTFVYNRYRI